MILRTSHREHWYRYVWCVKVLEVVPSMYGRKLQIDPMSSKSAFFSRSNLTGIVCTSCMVWNAFEVEEEVEMVMCSGPITFTSPQAW